MIIIIIIFISTVLFQNTKTSLVQTQNDQVFIISFIIKV